jgi:nucleotide-binding universal stress UspA family protein
MYNKILAPLDGSELSACSLDQLKQLTSPGGGTEVILLRVIEPLVSNDAEAWARSGYTVTEVQNKNKANALEYLSLAAGKLTHQGISARVEIMEGRAAESILEYAEKNGVDLILISSHGRSGISRWTFGSVADKVVRHSSIPVMVITPPGCRAGK